MAKTYSKPPKSIMKKQRDAGGYNAHGAKHTTQLGNEILRAPTAPKLPAKGLTPSKDRTRP